MPTWKLPPTPPPVQQAKDAIADWLRTYLDDSVVSDQSAPARVKRAVMKVPATAVNKALPLLGITERDQAPTMADLPIPGPVGMISMPPEMIRAFAAKAPGRLAERTLEQVRRLSGVGQDKALGQRLADITEGVAAERPERWGQLEELAISPRREGTTYGAYRSAIHDLAKPSYWRSLSPESLENFMQLQGQKQQQRLAQGMTAPTGNRITVAPLILQSRTELKPGGVFERRPLDLVERFKDILRHEGSHLGMDARDLLESGMAPYKDFPNYSANPHEVLAELEAVGLPLTQDNINAMSLIWHRTRRRPGASVMGRDLERLASGLQELTRPGAGSRIPYTEPSAQLSPGAFITDPRQFTRLAFPESAGRR